MDTTTTSDITPPADGTAPATTPATTTSADGTRIAVQAQGDGDPVVLIGGAFNDRSTMTALAAQLRQAPAGLATVQYDRRGRGDSGPIVGSPTAEQRLAQELADLQAVLDSVGGSAHVFGHSSGGVLALEAAARGLPVTRVAVYEPSFVLAGTREQPAADLGERIAAVVAAGDHDSAVALFLLEAVGLPAAYLDGMRQDPATWSGMTALAHTLPNDLALHEPGHPVPLSLQRIACPTLALDGGASPDWARLAVAAVADAVPGAQHRTLPGQDHAVLWAPEPLIAPLSDFFA